MPNSFDNFDKPYRRGLVLGLSLAEVFLILLFLLLLVSIGVTSSLQEDMNEIDMKRQELQDSLDGFRQVIGNKITVEEFTRLQKNTSAKQKLVRENKELLDQLSAAESKMAKTRDVIEIIEKYNIKPNQLKNIIKGERLQEALYEKKLLENKLAKTQKKVDSMAVTIDSFTDKGRDPSCWFRLVKDKKSGPNRKRRKM